MVVLTIELEAALAKTPGVTVPCKLTSPYRGPLTKFLNKYSQEAISYFLDLNRLPVSPPDVLPIFCHANETEAAKRKLDTREVSAYAAQAV